jgi:hypothetical protein
VPNLKNNSVDEKLLIIDDNIKRNNTEFANLFKTIFPKLRNKLKSSVNKAIDSEEQEDDLPKTESIYSRIWNKYLEDINDNDKLINESQDNLRKAYKSNNLDPDVALKVSRDDKIIFIITIFIIRQISLGITELFIDYNMLTSLYNSLVVYSAFYILIIIIIVLIVNIDDYKLRIVFNFFNMHINQEGIFFHIFGTIGIMAMIYLLIYNMMNSSEDTKAKATLSDVEKLKLIYRIELLTIFVFIVTSSLILVSG